MKALIHFFFFHLYKINLSLTAAVLRLWPTRKVCLTGCCRLVPAKGKALYVKLSHFKLHSVIQSVQLETSFYIAGGQGSVYSNQRSITCLRTAAVNDRTHRKGLFCKNWKKKKQHKRKWISVFINVVDITLMECIETSTELIQLNSKGFWSIVY